MVDEEVNVWETSKECKITRKLRRAKKRTKRRAVDAQRPIGKKKSRLAIWARR